MQNEKIKCEMVFFDAGMTLIRPEPQFEEGIRQVLAAHGFEPPIEEIIRHARTGIRITLEEIKSGRRYAISDEEDREFWADLYERLAIALGYTGDSRKIGHNMYKFYTQPHSFDLFDDSIPTLEALCDSGFRLGIISNFATMLDSSLRLRKIRHFFDPFIVSAAEGCMKPDREIFDIALERAGIPPKLCVMVGDNPFDDGKGAHSVGITPLIIDRTGKLEENGFRTIRALSELTEILEFTTSGGN